MESDLILFACSQAARCSGHRANLCLEKGATLVVMNLVSGRMEALCRTIGVRIYEIWTSFMGATVWVLTVTRGWI